jgi:hypothetical protein
MLPHSEKFDSVVCARVADIDLDGNNEILLGTYGQELLVYKEAPQPSNEYELCWKRGFTHPLMALETVDITMDGIFEVVALSMFGLHILATNSDIVQEKLLSAFDTLRDIYCLEEAIEQALRIQDAMKAALAGDTQPTSSFDDEAHSSDGDSFSESQQQ